MSCHVTSCYIDRSHETRNYYIMFRDVMFVTSCPVNVKSVRVKFDDMIGRVLTFHVMSCQCLYTASVFLRYVIWVLTFSCFHDDSWLDESQTAASKIWWNNLSANSFSLEKIRRLSEWWPDSVIEILCWNWRNKRQKICWFLFGMNLLLWINLLQLFVFSRLGEAVISCFLSFAFNP